MARSRATSAAATASLLLSLLSVAFGIRVATHSAAHAEDPTFDFDFSFDEHFSDFDSGSEKASTSTTTTTGPLPDPPAVPRLPRTGDYVGARPASQKLLSELRSSKWTLLLGDSILYLQFMELANEIGPSCGLSQELLRSEVHAPFEFFTKEPQEYAMICKFGGPCQLKNLGCVHFDVPGNCPSSEPVPCNFVSHRQCTFAEWKELADEISAADTEFAITFHWVPSTLGRMAPDINNEEEDPAPTATSAEPVVSRLRYGRSSIGAIVTNNCLHSHPTSLRLDKDKMAFRLRLFSELVSHNLDVLLKPEFSDFRGPVMFESCPKLMCELSQDAAECAQHQDELYEVNSALIEVAERHTQARQLRFYDIHAVLERRKPGIAYNDHMHPCWIRPCSWDAECRKALEAEQQAVYRSYDVALGIHNTHVDWYNRERIQFARVNLATSKAVEAWKASQGESANNTNAPPPLQWKVLVAQAAHGSLVSEHQRLVAEAAYLAQLHSAAPPKYVNNEGMCPELLDGWAPRLGDRSGLNTLHIGQPLQSGNGTVVQVFAPGKVSKSTTRAHLPPLEQSAPVAWGVEDESEVDPEWHELMRRLRRSEAAASKPPMVPPEPSPLSGFLSQGQSLRFGSQRPLARKLRSNRVP